MTLVFIRLSRSYVYVCSSQPAYVPVSVRLPVFRRWNWIVIPFAS